MLSVWNKRWVSDIDQTAAKTWKKDCTCNTTVKSVGGMRLRVHQYGALWLNWG